jgi:hypothetical protein
LLQERLREKNAGDGLSQAFCFANSVISNQAPEIKVFPLEILSLLESKHTQCE